MENTVFVPVFEQDGNKFFVAHSDFVGSTEDEAMKIGYGATLAECIFMNMKFTFTVKEIDAENIPHVKANLGNCTVAVFEGPLFQEAIGQGES